MAIVSYTHCDDERERETEFGRFKDALQFADSVIEDGGCASATVYCDTLEKEQAALALSADYLCSVHIERE